MEIALRPVSGKQEIHKYFSKFVKNRGVASLTENTRSYKKIRQVCLDFITINLIMAGG